MFLTRVGCPKYLVPSSDVLAPKSTTKLEALTSENILFTETSHTSLEISQAVLYYDKLLPRFVVCEFQKMDLKLMMNHSNSSDNLLHRTKIGRKEFLKNIFSKRFGNFSGNLYGLSGKVTKNTLLHGCTSWNLLNYVRTYVNMLNILKMF